MRLVALALDTKAEITYCNQHFLDLTGWTAGEVIGSNFIDKFVPRPDRVSAADFMQALLLDTPNAQFRQNAILTRSNELIVIRWNNTVVHDAAGHIVGVATIGEDISDRQELGREVLSGGARLRQHFAAELHDGLGQALHSASALADALQGALAHVNSPCTQDATDVADTIRHCLSTCRSIAQGLSPLALYGGGIIEALRELIHSRPNKTVDARLLVVESAPIVVGSHVLDHLFRLAQEAFSNALRHSSASDITLSLEIDVQRIVLKISDDGVGLARTTISPRLGMFLMQYRADIIGASLSVAANAPTGTLVTCDCPQKRPTNSGSFPA